MLVAEASFLIIVGMMACFATASTIRCDQRPPARSRALSALASDWPNRFCSPLVLALSSRVGFFACWHVLTTHREFSLAVSAKLAVILTVPCVSAQQH